MIKQNLKNFLKILLLNKNLSSKDSCEHDKKCLNDIDRKFISSSGPAPDKMYGTPKMNTLTVSNSFSKLQPIVCPVGAYNYKSDKYLGNLLSPHLPEHYYTKVTFKFVEFKWVSLVDRFVVSFDVTNLFYKHSIK